MSVLLTPAEFISDSYMGSSGTKPANAVQVAIDIAEGNISDALGYPSVDGTPTFLEQEWTEEHPWPAPNRPLNLHRSRLSAISSVYALHDSGTCDCEWTLLDACAFILETRQSLVQFRECSWVGSCWHTCACPHRIRITYTAGFTAAEVDATTEIGRRLRLATALTAREILDLQDFWTEGVAPIKNYSSMGYSETRDVVQTALGQLLGAGWLSEQAARLIAPLVIRGKKKAIVIRSQ